MAKSLINQPMANGEISSSKYIGLAWRGVMAWRWQCWLILQPLAAWLISSSAKMWLFSANGVAIV
jgi:hypothetical protein